MPQNLTCPSVIPGLVNPIVSQPNWMMPVSIVLSYIVLKIAEHLLDRCSCNCLPCCSDSTQKDSAPSGESKFLILKTVGQFIYVSYIASYVESTHPFWWYNEYIARICNSGASYFFGWRLF